MKSTKEKQIDLIGLLIDEMCLDIKKYSELQYLASDNYSKEILRGIHLDKTKHKSLLEEIYKSISGDFPSKPVSSLNQILDYKKQLQKNILDETDNSRFFGDLYMAFDNTPYLTPLSVIINDLHNHALINLYLYLKV